MTYRHHRHTLKFDIFISLHNDDCRSFLLCLLIVVCGVINELIAPHKQQPALCMVEPRREGSEKEERHLGDSPLIRFIDSVWQLIRWVRMNWKSERLDEITDYFLCFVPIKSSLRLFLIWTPPDVLENVDHLHSMWHKAESCGMCVWQLENLELKWKLSQHFFLYA